MRWRKKAALFVLMLVASLVAVLISTGLMQPKATLATEAFLQPAPTQPLGYYDYFGKLLNPDEAIKLVQNQGLDPNDSISYQRIGAVQITPELIKQGEDIFFNRKIGDTFGLQRVFGFGLGLVRILPELSVAVAQLHGQSTNNLQITLLKNITLGSQTFLKGTVINTGLKVEKGALFPVGITQNGNITCAVCHTVLSNEGKRLVGVPNSIIATPLLVALAPNSSAAFTRLKLNPLDPQFQGNGKTIIDSEGKLVELPDPQKFEQAFDDSVLDVPFGNFESSADGINNTTQIPSIFTFGTNPYFFDGQFAVGSFAGLSAVNNGVHSSEVNLSAAAQLSSQTLGIDPEVYIGTFLQNAADPRLRLPAGAPLKPSDWLHKVAPDVTEAELEDQVAAPGTGIYPNLRPSLFTYNGLVFSPKTGNSDDVASGNFLFAENAMAAFQNSLVPPANLSPENREALSNGSVVRGAKVFEQANCATCHIPSLFTDNKIHPVSEIGTNPARAQSRLRLSDLLVPPKLYSFDTPVPIPANAQVLDLPTGGISDSPTTLPKGILPDGGYKTTSLRGLYSSAPYLHDSGVAVRAGSLQIASDGSFIVVDATGLGLSGTLSQSIPADPASSLRALVDRNLRALVIAANKAYPALVRSNLDGTGHDFYVDTQARFTPQQQTDLINFLLALDEDPSHF